MTEVTKNHLHLMGFPDRSSPLRSVLVPLRRIGILFASSSKTPPTSMTLRPLSITGNIPFTEFIDHLDVRFGFLNLECSVVLITRSLQNSVIDLPPNGTRSVVTTRAAISLSSRTRLLLLDLSLRLRPLRFRPCRSRCSSPYTTGIQARKRIQLLVVQGVRSVRTYCLHKLTN